MNLVDTQIFIFSVSFAAIVSFGAVTWSIVNRPRAIEPVAVYEAKPYVRPTEMSPRGPELADPWGHCTRARAPGRCRDKWAAATAKYGDEGALKQRSKEAVQGDLW